MKRLVPTDCKGLFKDLKSGGVLNLDEAAYREHQKQKIIRQKRLELEKAKEERINTIEKDVSELKEGIAQILEILKNGHN